MKLSKQVCSLDLAKMLKELGVEQESLFYWANWTSKWRGVTTEHCGVLLDDQFVEYSSFAETQPEPMASAFTAAELGELLPLQVDGFDLQLWREKGKSSWDVAYNTDSGNLNPEVWEQADTEADARAKMLIYLLENKLIN